MASNKAKIRNMQAKADTDLGKTLLKIVALGVAGSAALLGAAQALGEAIEDIQAEDQKRLEAQRETDKENVRRIEEHAVGAEQKR